MTSTLRGRLVSPSGVYGGEISFNTHIETVTPLPTAGPYLLPGFIDAHVHGGGGADTMDGAEGVRTLSRFHLEHGSTTLYPTTITNPWEKIVDSLRDLREVIQEADPLLPALPGAHLEGPFISPKRLGAQPPYTITPTAELVAELLEIDVIRLVTLAPEIPGALEAALRFTEVEARVSIGHTAASFEQVREFVNTVQGAGGTTGFTHLFNAMGGLAGREPGVVGAAFADHNSYTELILDGHHVHQGSFLAALAAKGDQLLLVTDAIRAAGLPEGTSELGGQIVTVRGGSARLPGGTLAGSVLTLDRAFRNAVGYGLPLEKASASLSAVPARYLGISDRGILEAGKRADLIVMDQDLAIQEVYVAGRKVVG
jgi:N-acetylglucosamine-6-phosphate deacetylase